VIERKIRKLLKLANDPAASEHERALALAMASRLAAEADVDVNRFRADDEREYGLTRLARWSVVPAYAFSIGNVLELHFRVVAIHTRLYPGEELNVFGSRPNREIAKYVYACLRREFLAAAKVWRRGLNRRASAAEERGFFISVAAGLNCKMKDLAKRAAMPAGLIPAPDLTQPLEEFFGRNIARKTALPKRMSDVGFELGKKITIRPAVRTDVETQKLIGSAKSGGVAAQDSGGPS